MLHRCRTRVLQNSVFTTEATAQFIGFLRLAEIAMFLPVLQLNIARTNQKVVAEVVCMCILEYEKNYYDCERVPEEIIFNSMTAMYETRKQIKSAYD